MNRAEKKPQAGEWWEYNGVRVYVVGAQINGFTVCEYRDGRIDSLTSSTAWRHLPDCTGWDWKPEVFPQWYKAKTSLTSASFHRRDSKTKVVGVDRDGSEWDWSYPWKESDRHLYAEITREQAEALLDKPEQEMRTVTLTHWICWDNEGQEYERVSAHKPAGWGHVVPRSSKTVEVPR